MRLLTIPMISRFTMTSVLDQLKQFTKVVADSGDIQSESPPVSASIRRVIERTCFFRKIGVDLTFLLSDRRLEAPGRDDEPFPHSRRRQEARIRPSRRRRDQIREGQGRVSLPPCAAVARSRHSDNSHRSLNAQTDAAVDRLVSFEFLVALGTSYSSFVAARRIRKGDSRPRSRTCLH